MHEPDDEVAALACGSAPSTGPGAGGTSYTIPTSSVDVPLDGVSWMQGSTLHVDGRTVETGVRAESYALVPDGVLVTCSCSGKLDRAGFEEMVLAAAADAKRPVQILERRGAGLDHPVLGGLLETEYLKALYVRAL